MKKKTATPTPKPATVATISAEQLAGLANLTKRRLYQLAEENRIPQATDGSFPMLATITALFSYYQRDGETLQREKTLKTAAERKLREHQLGIAEKQYMPTADVGRAASNIGATIRTMIIQKISRDFPVQAEKSAPLEMKNTIRQEAAKIGETATSEILFSLHNATRAMTGQPAVAFAQWTATNKN